MQDVTSSVTFPSFYCMSDVPFLFDRMSYFLTMHAISPADLHPSPAPYFKTLLQIFHKNCSNSKCWGQVGSTMPSCLNPSCLSLETNYLHSLFFVVFVSSRQMAQVKQWLPFSVPILICCWLINHFMPC